MSAQMARPGGVHGPRFGAAGPRFENLAQPRSGCPFYIFFSISKFKYSTKFKFPF
jgi:hypothetical protein